MNTFSKEAIDDLKRDAADLYWLSFLLTGRRDLSIEIAADAVAPDDSTPFFARWMRSWSRRIVLVKALAAIRTELGESADRTKVARDKQAEALPAPAVDENFTKEEIEEALLAIDLFPRAAVVLLIFEGVRIAEAVSLLNADAELIRKAQAMGLQQFARNIVTRKGLTTPKPSRRWEFGRSLRPKKLARLSLQPSMQTE
jgi:integrase